MRLGRKKFPTNLFSQTVGFSHPLTRCVSEGCDQLASKIGVKPFTSNGG